MDGRAQEKNEVTYAQPELGHPGANANGDSKSPINRSAMLGQTLEKIGCGYRYVFRLYINPVFDNRRIDEIEREDIKRFIDNKQAEGRSAATSRLIHS